MERPYDSQQLLEDVYAVLSPFGASPTESLGEIELKLPQLTPGPSQVATYVEDRSITGEALGSAQRLKTLFGELNVITHALGMLVALPRILDEDEKVETLTLGAGNTGKDFDLTTNMRVAEFKFIEWKGQADEARQRNVFKDFLKLLWDTSGKRKQLYLTGTHHAFRFLNGRRNLSSVLSKNNKMKQDFDRRYGAEFNTVGQFFQKYQRWVEIIELSKLIPTMSNQR